MQLEFQRNTNIGIFITRKSFPLHLNNIGNTYIKNIVYCIDKKRESLLNCMCLRRETPKIFKQIAKSLQEFGVFRSLAFISDLRKESVLLFLRKKCES